MSLRLRRAKPTDAPALVKLIVALAKFEKLTPPNAAARKRLIKDGFGPRLKFEPWLAFWDGEREPVGYMILVKLYSSFEARPTLYLEDLFVLPEYRGCGIGKAMMRRCIELACKRGCGRMEWEVLDWNQHAIDFYERLGAKRLHGWQAYRLVREDMEKIIQSTGFFRAKTTSLMGLGQALCDRFGGEVPSRLRDLVTLPGVGRKTANVVLGNAFGVPGITVDTHFARLARRFGWTTRTDPVKIESEVGALFPRSEWTMLSHRLIWHGRRVCHARRPACGACEVARLCPSFGIGPTDPEVARALVKEGPFS